MVITAWAPRTAAAGVAAIAALPSNAPALERGPVPHRHLVASWIGREVIIGTPIAPRPRKPTVAVDKPWSKDPGVSPHSRASALAPEPDRLSESNLHQRIAVKIVCTQVKNRVLALAGVVGIT
jgi:hypothetical protein